MKTNVEIYTSYNIFTTKSINEKHITDLIYHTLSSSYVLNVTIYKFV